MTNVLPNVGRILIAAQTKVWEVLQFADSKRGADADDFAFWAVDLTVGEHCESGVNNSQYFVVDIETGILILEAARKIIDERVASTAPESK